MLSEWKSVNAKDGTMKMCEQQLQAKTCRQKYPQLNGLQIRVPTFSVSLILNMQNDFLAEMHFDASLDYSVHLISTFWKRLVRIQRTEVLCTN